MCQCIGPRNPDEISEIDRKSFSCKAYPGTCVIQKPGIPRGSRGGVTHGGGAGRGGWGRVERQAGFQETTVPLAPEDSTATVLEVAPEARTSEILCKLVQEQNPR